MKPCFLCHQVKWVEQQEILDRFKRDGIPTDPEFDNMWYLVSLCFLTVKFCRYDQQFGSIPSAKELRFSQNHQVIEI